MKVEELKNCDIRLTDITDEEYGAMFLEGIHALVQEARDGKVGDYIVVPYEEAPDEIKNNPNNRVWEVSDEDSDALVQIGAVSMIMKGIREKEWNEQNGTI